MSKINISVLREQKIKNFILLQVFFNGLVAILNLFVNTFLLKSFGNSSGEVLFYNLIQALAQPIAMMTSFALSRKKSYLFTQRIGFLFYCIVLIILCIFGEQVAFLYPLFGILISFGAGYYFSIYSVQMMAYTTDENRDLVSGATTVLCSIISLILPLLAGFIISATNAYVGYRIVFGLEGLLALIALFTTTRLAPIEKKDDVLFWDVYRKITNDKNGKLILIANGLERCCGSTITFYITVLIYNLIQSELLASVNTTIGSILAIIGAALYGIIVNKENRFYSIFISTIVVLVPCILMCFKLSVYLLIIFYALYNLCNMFMSAPILNIYFRVMERIEGLQGMGAQIHTVREIFVSFGRILGIMMIMCIPQTNIGSAITLALLMLTSLINVLIVKKVEKALLKED